MAYDANKLFAQLQNTGLQNKDNPLYQLIYLLIQALGGTQGDVTRISSLINNITNNTIDSSIINQFIMSGGDSGGDDGLIVPGPVGPTGATGSSGATGPAYPVFPFPEDGEDGNQYPPIVGPQGNPGTTGPTGPIAPMIPSNEEYHEENIIQVIQQSTGSSSPSGLVLLGSRTASASATLDFTSLITSAYDVYVFEFENILPATDNVDFLMRTSTDNGSNYDSGAGNYQYAQFVNNTGSFSTDDVCSAADTAIKIAPTIDNGSTTGGINGFLKLYNPLNATQYKSVGFHVNGFLNDNQFYNIQGSGWRVATADIDAVRFLMSSGNIASGTIRMYGIKNS